jgi:hypothetical protein
VGPCRQPTTVHTHYVALPLGNAYNMTILYCYTIGSLTATLREFLHEHLSMGYIQPTQSLHGAPILFVKKKDGPLWLCVNFWSLKNIMKKDLYPIPLIMHHVMLGFIQRSTLGMHIIWSESWKVMNGRLPFKPTMACLSGKSCLSVLPMVPWFFNIS